MKKFDAIIIGSGQGGTPLAKKLALQGWNTALVEMDHIGGTCVNIGCTPTKTMVASAKAAYFISKAGELGVDVGKATINMPVILKRKQKVVDSFRNGAQSGLEKTENLELIFGEASFKDAKTIEVVLNDGGKESITADKIFIDTGTRPSIPDVGGLEETGYFTSTTLMEFEKIPEHLLIIGGGYIGLEFGQMYRRFGSRITILEHGEKFLYKEDEDIAAEIRKFLKEEEIIVHTNAQIQKVKKNNSSVSATVLINGKEQLIECSHLLISAGRIPNTDRLNLRAAGVNINERGYITVNDKLETAAEGIYAIGDVKGGPEFTHISYNDYIVLYNNLVKEKNDSIANRLVPYTMFTDPQLGRIGITEKEANRQGLNIKVATLPMAHVARAIETGDTRGMMKAVVDAENGKILGAAIVGQEGGEIMSVLQMAMVGNITWPQIRTMVFAHPLYAESLNNLFMQFDEQA